MGKLSNKTVAMRVSAVSMAINIALSAFKLFAGIFAHSSAMVADAVESGADVLSTIVVMIGVHLSDKKADKGHPFGHERLECVAAILLSAMLCATGVGIGYDGVQKIILGLGAAGTLQTPGLLALIAAVGSIAVKEWMYWYTRAAAKKTESGALLANAWHHRSDAFSSVGTLIGIAGARLGLPVLDPIASLVTCLFIAKISYSIFMDAVKKMTDAACDDETVERMSALVRSYPEVCSLDLIRTRIFGSKIFVDIEISIDGRVTLAEAHAVAERIHDEIESDFQRVKHCMVHVNPSGDGIS